MPISNLHHLDVVDGRFGLTTPADLDALFQALAASPQAGHLVLHVHGGLVGRASGQALAERLLPAYAEAGAWPVFFVWNSGPFTTLIHNLDEVAQEPAFWRLVRRLAQMLAGKLAESALNRGDVLRFESLKDMPADPQGLLDWTRAREPQDAPEELSAQQVQQIEAELQRDPVLKAEAAAIAAELRDPAQVAQEEALRPRGGPPVKASRRTLMSPAVLKKIASESPDPGTRSLSTVLALAKYGAQIAVAVIRRHHHDRDHGLLTTIVEEVARTLYADSIGATVWSLMKGDTADAFNDDPQQHAGSAFVQRLAAWWQPGRRITLVGHSTGALTLAHLLRQADALLPAAARFDLVLLAPACTHAFLHRHLPVLERRVAGFRMFALNDTLETGYWEVPVLYPASLLYMVSGLFEDEEVDMPIVGLQRHFQPRGPYDVPAVRAVSQWIGPRVVWSAHLGGPGLACDSPQHGGFDKNPATVASLQHILRHGF